MSIVKHYARDGRLRQVLLPPACKALFTGADVSCKPMDSELKDRMAEAMARNSVSVRDLVDATGLSKSAIHFILRGTARRENLRAVNIDMIAERLNVDRDWLLYGRGTPEREGFIKERGAGCATPHFHGIDPAILARADFWLSVEERAGIVFQPLRRWQRMIELYEQIQTDGGDLSAEHALELVQATQQGSTHARGNQASQPR